MLFLHIRKYEKKFVTHTAVIEPCIYYRSFSSTSFTLKTTMTLPQLFHSDIAITFPQRNCHDYYCCNCSTVTLIHCYYCSPVTLLRLFHNNTVAIVPQWHCYICFIVRLLQLFLSDTVTIALHWNCCNWSLVILLQVVYSDNAMAAPLQLQLFHTVSFTIVSQWHYYNCSKMIPLQLSVELLMPMLYSDTFTIIRQW